MCRGYNEISKIVDIFVSNIKLFERNYFLKELVNDYGF